MVSKCSGDNWLNVQLHHRLGAFIHRHNSTLDPCEVEVHQHQKDAFCWLKFKHKLPDTLYQPGFTLTNCESKNSGQEIGIRVLML